MLRNGRPDHQSAAWNVYVPAGQAPMVVRHVENLTTPVTTSITPFVPGA